MDCISESLRQRFWSKVKIGTPEECWLWTACLMGKGYGYFYFSPEKRLIGAHRVSWTLTNGKSPGSLHVLHTCDNPKCVNPSHLFLGTNTENVHDMVRKGRACIGEKQGRSKLKAKQVIEIRQRYAENESQYKLAAEFGVSQGHISDIVLRQRWKHI